MLAAADSAAPISSDSPVIEVDHPEARGRIAHHGAHVLDWTPAGERPVLYLSPTAVFRPGKAIRGGIPVCWPWFGPAVADGLPAHGLARTRPWTLEATEAMNDGVSVRFSLRDDAATHELWPHAFAATLRVHFGRSLHVALHVENRDPEPVEITAALHTYLAVSDVRRVSVLGLEGAEYQDHVGPLTVRRQGGPVEIGSEVDRDYETDGPVTLVDPGWRRHIVVQGHNSRCTVVWNPWIAKSATFSDLPPDAWPHFLCLETANAWRDRVTIPPGQAHELATTITVVRPDD